MRKTYAQRDFQNLSTDIMPKKADIVTGDCKYGIVSYDGSGRIHASRINSRGTPHFITPGGNGCEGVGVTIPTMPDPELRRDKSSEDSWVIDIHFRFYH